MRTGEAPGVGETMAEVQRSFHEATATCQEHCSDVRIVNHAAAWQNGPDPLQGLASRNLLECLQLAAHCGYKHNQQ